MGEHKFGVDPVACEKIAAQVKETCVLGQVGVVIGGGNISRGRGCEFLGWDGHLRTTSGVLADLTNGIALQQSFEKVHCESRIMSAIACDVMAESYSWRDALKYLDKGIVLIFVGGTGNPYFTTDSAAALRALEINAQILLEGDKSRWDLRQRSP